MGRPPWQITIPAEISLTIPKAVRVLAVGVRAAVAATEAGVAVPVGATVCGVAECVSSAPKR